MKYFLIVLCLFICGCRKQNNKAVEAVSVRPVFASQEDFLSQFPTDSKNIKDIGNGWFTFDCVVSGKNRTFLLGRYRTYGSYISGTITELK